MTVVVLRRLEEIVALLENDKDFIPLLREKIHRTMLDKNPFYQGSDTLS